ncbi:hypothetical protein, partial [Thiolapillus sp.]|uniref:hypothetical protein n=1 Tax=Thiolapillus sp. TaxID=2017437 RepID=UPI0025F9577B
SGPLRLPETYPDFWINGSFCPINKPQTPSAPDHNAQLTSLTRMFHQDAHFSRRDFRSDRSNGLGGKIQGKSA